MGPDTFAPETDPAARFTFTISATGRTESMRIVQGDGSTSKVRRESETRP